MEFSDIGAVVVDVEGTTSSIEFVQERLFPYARQRLPAYVSEHAAEIRDILEEIRRSEGDAELDVPRSIVCLLRWMDEDRKVTPLKTLQGLIWREGYESGALRAPVYPDALRALERWHRQGITLYVYSSGSVAAQRLLFAHTEHGDLTGLFSGYFDTTTGPKLRADSYRAIAASIAMPAARLLFLSDHPGEVAAARAAGMQAVWVDRAGARTSDGIQSFDEVVMPDAEGGTNANSR
jgi:enolase-phosphatase E1